MKSLTIFASFLLLIFISSSCATVSSLGPQAEVKILEKEVKKTKLVNGIVIANPVGPNIDAKTKNTLLALALKTYGKRARPIQAVEALIQQAGLPKELPQLMTVNYDAGLAAAFEKSKGKAPRKVKFNQLGKGASIKTPKSLDDLKNLKKNVVEQSENIGELAASMTSGGIATLLPKAKEMPTLMALIRKMDKFVFNKINATYVLVMHTDGNEATYEAGKQVKITAALVNTKNGRIRYVASVSGKKGTIPTPYVAQIGLMANSLFSRIDEIDPLN